MEIKAKHFEVTVYSDSLYGIVAHIEIEGDDSITSAEVLYEGDGYLGMQEFTMNPQDTMNIIDMRGE